MMICEFDETTTQAGETDHRFGLISHPYQPPED